jgi:protein TonB
MLHGLAAGCLLLGVAYAALLAVAPLLRRPVDLPTLPPYVPSGTIEHFVIEHPVAPAGPIHHGPSIPQGVPVPVPATPETPVTLAEQGSGLPGPADHAQDDGGAFDDGTLAPHHELQPGEFVYREQEPQLVFQVKPVYPEFAVQAQVEGTVLLWALVETDGRVGQVRVQRSVPLLDEAAVAAVRRWRFTPALASEKPVRVWVSIPVRFSLR